LIYKKIPNTYDGLQFNLNNTLHNLDNERRETLRRETEDLWFWVDYETHNVHHAYKQIGNYNILHTRDLDDLNRRLRDKVQEYNTALANTHVVPVPNEQEIDNGLYGMNRDIILKTSVKPRLKDQDIRELFDTAMSPNKHWNRHPYFKKHTTDNLNNLDNTPKFGFTPQRHLYM
jgi:hypothetical protein